MSEHVEIVEVGPRDGLQNVQAVMPTELKIRWIAALAAAGVGAIEVGSFVPSRLVPQMGDTDAVARASLTALPDVEIVALVPNLKGAEHAYAAGVSTLAIPVSVSEGHSRANSNKGTFEQVEELGRLVAWLRTQERPVRVEAGCATAFGCSIDGVVAPQRVVEVAVALAECGVDRVTLADTVGYADPAAIRRVVRAVRAEIGGRLEKLHLHDTMGLGLANALAGLEEGVRGFDAALAGLGGCPFAPGAAGNIVTEDLVYMLESMGFSTGIDLEALIATRAYLREGLGGVALRGSLAAAGMPKTYKRAVRPDAVTERGAR